MSALVGYGSLAGARTMHTEAYRDLALFETVLDELGAADCPIPTLVEANRWVWRRYTGDAAMVSFYGSDRVIFEICANADVPDGQRLLWMQACSIGETWAAHEFVRRWRALDVEVDE